MVAAAVAAEAVVGTEMKETEVIALLTEDNKTRVISVIQYVIIVKKKDILLKTAKIQRDPEKFLEDHIIIIIIEEVDLEIIPHQIIIIIIKEDIIIKTEDKALRKEVRKKEKKIIFN